MVTEPGRQAVQVSGSGLSIGSFPPGTWPEPGAHYPPLLDLLRTAEAIWEASRVFFSRWNLSPSQFNILNLLRNHPGGLSQTELSRDLIVHRSNITGLVDRLECRHLLERRAHATDRRAHRVVLTPEGTRLLHEILPHYFREVERVWEDFPPSHATELVRALHPLHQRALERVQELATPAGPTL